jgi:hypothetical protein
MLQYLANAENGSRNISAIRIMSSGKQSMKAEADHLSSCFFPRDSDSDLPPLVQLQVQCHFLSSCEWRDAAATAHWPGSSSSSSSPGRCRSCSLFARADPGEVERDVVVQRS